jgi:hypothetical protein
MDNLKEPSQPAVKPKMDWLLVLMVILVCEKIIQHVTVSLAFIFDWMGIRESVAVDYRILLVSGAIVAVLFGLDLWGLLTGRKWAIPLVIGLAIFDILGEFFAQGVGTIVITVSFLVAWTLLLLALIERSRGRNLKMKET